MTTRIVSGVILAALAVAVIVEGGGVYFAVVLLLGLLATAEYLRLVRHYRPLPLAAYAGVAFMLAEAWFGSLQGVFGAVCAAVALAMLLGLAKGPKPGVTGRVAVTLLGALWVGLGFAALLLLRRLDMGTAAVLTVVFGTWAGDTMAYFTGRFFGATAMAPQLSPKKTWEGFAGGFLSTVLVVVFAGLYTPLHPGESLLLGLAIAVAGPLGDLFESLVKRDVQMKDSGRGIPGHGGILDRFDALLWAAVVSYFVLVAGLGY